MFRNSRFAAATGLLLATIGVAIGADAKLKGKITIDGSSTVEPITSAVSEEFSIANTGVQAPVGISGTGGGFKRFVAGETDISNASRPIKKEEAEACAKNGVEFVEVPVAYDGLTLVVNSKNNWVDTLTLAEVKKIYLADGGVKLWSDIRPEWPKTAIKVFSPGTDSGTFDYFKEVVADKGGSIRSDMQVSEDDNVLVTGVSNDPNAIGFFGCAYYFENKDKLKALKIDAGKGAIAPTHETIENGTYAPFSRPLFIYVNKKSASRPEVKAFVEFYLAQAPELVEEVKYVKLPSELYARAATNFQNLKTGTQFLNAKGEKVHGPLSEIYK